MSGASVAVLRLPAAPALAPDLATADRADRLHAELAVVRRRLARATGEAERLEASAAEAWSPVALQCRVALDAVSASIERVPVVDCLPEADRGWTVCGPLRVSAERRAASWDGRPLELTSIEVELLALFAVDPWRVVPKSELLRKVWGFQHRTPSTRTVDTHASRLRRKLYAAGGANGAWIVNVWGVGYALRPPHDEGSTR